MHTKQIHESPYLEAGRDAEVGREAALLEGNPAAVWVHGRRRLVHADEEPRAEVLELHHVPVPHRVVGVRRGAVGEPLQVLGVLGGLERAPLPRQLQVEHLEQGSGLGLAPRFRPAPG